MEGSFRTPGRPRFGFCTILLLGFLLLATAACESTLMREFNHHMAGNNLEASSRVLDRELRANPNNAEANYLKGNLLYRQKNFSEGNNYFERSLNASSVYREHIEYLKERNYRVELNSGLEAFESENYSRAVRQFNLANNVYPEQIEVYPLMGYSYKQIDQTEDAIQSYRSCLEIEPAHLECGINLAELYYSEERYNEAINLSQRMNSSHPENWRPLQILLDSYLQTDQFDSAEEMLAQLSSLRNHYQTLKNFAMHMVNHGEDVRAEHYLRECLTRQPNDADVLRSLAEIYLNSRNYDLVIEAGERLLAAEPDNRTIKAQMMIAYEITGDIDRYKEMQQELGLTEE